jgi:hypothetical protein
MNTQVPIASVKQFVVVEAPIEQAFKVFTEEFGSFKPAEHNLLTVQIAETVFERPGSAATSMTVASTAVNAAGHVFWPMSRPTACS